MAFDKDNLVARPLGKRNGKLRFEWFYYSTDAFSTVDNTNYFAAVGPLGARGQPIMQHGDPITCVTGTAGSEATTLARVEISGTDIAVAKTVTVA